MSDKQAEEIIALQKREEDKQANFRTLWQNTANYIFPRENNITNTMSRGAAKTETAYDTTAITDSADMASGLSNILFPPGLRFFSLRASDRVLNEQENIKNYLNLAAETTHNELFASNFMLQLNETLRSLIVFGTGNIYSEWTVRTGLNFRDWDVGSYQILENAAGRVDTMILKFPFTARQASQAFENPGKSVLEAMAEEKNREKSFDFIHIVRPRKNRNVLLEDSLNMPFESVYVAVKDKATVEEGGFEEFPYHVPRWMKTTGEINGRGQGTEILPQVRVLNQIMCDFIECGNKWNNPPREVLESFEGEVNVTPGAINWVTELPSIKSMDEGVRGNFPITKDILEMQREVVHKAFYRNVFDPLTELTGDRRTTLEIRQRIREAYKKLSSPIGRIQAELLDPLIIRAVRLLVRNGVLAPPPVRGLLVNIEYEGELALALKSAQANAFQNWVLFVSEIEGIWPGAKDNVSIDNAVRDMGRTLGVKNEHIASEQERDAAREMRAQQLQQKQVLETAQAAAQGYGQITKAPESGSPAEALQEALVGE